MGEVASLGKTMLIPQTINQGFFIEEASLRLFAAGELDVFGDGSEELHDEVIRALVGDYVSLYKKLEELGEIV